MKLIVKNNIFLITVFLPCRNNYGIHTLNKQQSFLYRKLKENTYKAKTTDDHVKIIVILSYIKIIKSWY